ncbi:MAG: RidA family protein [Alphaproteobacteria bacterium]|nr:RidA family protein [Alphaproteobacteria bacterium]
MARTYVWPKGHWDWHFKVVHKHGLRVGDLCFVGGQVDVDQKGVAQHAGDLHTQIDVVTRHIGTVLGHLGADLDDVTKLVMFYVNDGKTDEMAALKRLRRHFKGPVPPAVMPVPLPVLAYPGMMVEIEAIAMRKESGARMARTPSNPKGHWASPFSHGIRCGEMIWVGAQDPRDAEGHVRAAGDPVEQAKLNIENVRRVLAGFGAELDDVCRINSFFVGHGTAKDWARAADVRAHAFKWPGPVGTGLPVPALFPNGLTIRQEACAMLAVDGAHLPRESVRPTDHWDWPIPVNFQQGVKCGNVIFVGGQVALDGKGQGKAEAPGDLVKQTHLVMNYIRKVLAAYGATMDDAVKVNAFYCGGASAEKLKANLAIRSSCFTEPGPTTTGIPLAHIAAEGLEIEVEAYAILD